MSTWEERWPRERVIEFILRLPQGYVDLTFRAIMETEFPK